MGCFCDKCSFETFKTNIGEVHELPCGGFFREYEERPKFAHAHRTPPAEYLGANCKWQSNGQLANQPADVFAQQMVNANAHHMGVRAQQQFDAQLQAITQGQNLQAGLQWQNDRQAQWGGVTYCNKCGGTMKEDGAHNCQAAAMAQQHQMQMDAIRSNHDFARGEAFAKDELARADGRIRELQVQVGRLQGELARPEDKLLFARLTETDAVVEELKAKLKVYEEGSKELHETAARGHRRANSLQERIKELEAIIASSEDANGTFNAAQRWGNEQLRRANQLSDECGALKTQNTELLAENARLRRGGK